MTTLHDDPFNSSRIRKEADQERSAAEKRIEAQEEARKRSARQRLEDEKLRLTRERDDKKRKLEEIQREVEEAKKLKKKEEFVVATERQTSTERGVELHDEKEKRLLAERLMQIQRDLAHLAASHHGAASASSAGQKDAQTIARKLSSAQAALEKATVEHTHVTQEITVLTRTLEQKRAQEEQHRREKTEAAAVLKEIEVEEERAGTASDHERERLEKEKAEAEHVEREKGRLLKEQAEVQDKLIKIEERAKQHGSEKRHHDEERRKAEEEAMREGNVIRDLERRAGILSRDIQSLEEGLRALEHKISRL